MDAEALRNAETLYLLLQEGAGKGRKWYALTFTYYLRVRADNIYLALELLRHTTEFSGLSQKQWITCLTPTL